MHARGFMVGLVSLLLIAPAFGANGNDAAVRDRYLDSALKNPRRGTAVERLYQLALQTDGIEPLLAELEKKAAASSGVDCWTLIGLLQDMRGRDVDAIKAFEQAAKADPKAGYPRFCLGSEHLNRSEYDKGITALLAAQSCKLSPEDNLEVRKALGRCYLRARQFDKAKQVWADLVKLDPNDAVTLKELTSLLVEEEQWDEALEYYAKLRTVLKDRAYQAVLCTMAMGQVESRRGNFDKALAHYQEALAQVKPDSWLATDVRTRVQELFRKRNDLSGLVAYYEKRLGGPDASDVRTMVLHAQLLVELNRTKDAQPWFTKAIELSPKDADIRLSYIHMLETQKDYATAIKQYESLLETNPANPVWLEAIGSLCLKAASDDAAKAKAKEYWSKIAADNAKDAATMVQVAEIFRGHEMNADAGEYFRKAVELAPEVGQYREYLGEFLLKQNNRNEALAAIKQIAEGPRRNIDTLMRLADVLGYLGFADESLAAARDAVALKPEHFDARMQLAKLLGGRGQFDDAIKELDEAAKHAPNEFFAGAVVDERIEMLQKAQRLQQVFDAAVSTLQTTPADKPAPYVECAKMAMALSKIEQAEQVIDLALERAKDSVPALELAAKIRARGGESDKLIATLNRLIEVAPQNRKDYLRQLATHYAQMGDRDQAIKAAEQVVAAGPDDPEAHGLLANLCERFGMPDQSIKSLKEALKVAPKNVDLRLQYARQLEHSGEFENSIEQLWIAFDAQEEASDKLNTMRLLADTCYRADRFSTLIDRLERMRRTTQDEWLPVMCMAEAYRQIQDLTKARELLNSLLAERPDDANMLKQVVELAATEGLNEEAVRHLQKLAELEPSKKNLLQLADMLYGLGRKDDAVATWRKLVEQADDKQAALAEVSRELLTREESDTALNLMAAEVKKSTDNLDLAYQYACALMAAGRKDEARREFARVAEMPDPPAPAKKKTAAPTANTPQSALMQMLPPEILRYQKMRNIRYQVRGQMSSTGNKSGPASIQGDPDTVRAAAWYEYCSLSKDAGEYDALVADLKKQNTPKSLGRLLECYGLEDRWPPEATAVLDELGGRKDLEPGMRCVVLFMTLENALSSGANAPPDDAALQERCDKMRTIIDQVSKETPSLRPMLGSYYLYFLKRANRKDEVKAYAHKLAAQDMTDQMQMAIALSALCEAEELDEAIKLMDRISKQASGANSGPFQYRQYLLMQLASLAVKQNRPEDAARIAMDCLRTTRPQNSRVFNSTQLAFYSQYGQQSEFAFPNANTYFDQSRLQMLQQFHPAASGIDPRMAGMVGSGARRATSLPANLGKVRSISQPAAANAQPAPPASEPEKPSSEALIALRKRLEADTRSLDEEDRVYANLALAYLDWWSDKKQDASKHLTAACDLRPQDISLRMSLAYLRYNMEDKKGTLEALAAIPGRYHPAYLPAQQLTLRIAKELQMTDEAKAAALRLFNMKLSTKDQLELAADLRSLGLAQKAQQIEQRVKTLSANDINQLVQLMQTRAKSDKKEAAGLARQILAQLDKAGSNQSYYRERALEVLKESGELKELIAAAEKQLAENPKALRVLMDLFYYYLANDNNAKAVESAQAAIALRPEDMTMRKGLAETLMRQKQYGAAVEQYRQILSKDPSAIFQSSMWETVRAFSQAKKTGELLKMVTALDWSRLKSGNYGSVSNQLINLLQYDSNCFELPEALLFINKLNDYVVDQKASGYELSSAIEYRCRVLTASPKRFIRDWQVIGAFENDKGSGWDKAYPPETEPFNTDAKYAGLDGETKWTPYVLGGDTFVGTRDAKDIKRKENIIVYAHTIVESEVDGDAKAYVGSDDGVKVFVNGKLVHANNATRGLTRDADTFTMPLHKGRNDVLLKINQGAGEWGFCMRVEAPGTDENRQKLERQWHVLRYLLAFSEEFKGFKPTPPKDLPANLMDQPLGVKTSSCELLTSGRSWSTMGNPSGVVDNLLSIAGEMKQFEAMRAFLDTKESGDKDIAIRVWKAMLDLKLDRLDAAKAAASKLAAELSANVNQQDAWQRMGALAWLDTLLAEKKLWPESTECCRAILDLYIASNNFGMENLFYRRLADRLGKLDRKKDAKEVLMLLAEANMAGYANFGGNYAQERKLENMSSAAEGLNELGYYRDAYTMIVKLNKMADQYKLTSYWQVDQARRLADNIRKAHPELGASIVAACMPVSGNAIRVIWGKGNKAECDKRGNTYAEAPTKTTGLEGYTAEILAAANTRDTYHKIGTVPADKQEFLYADAPVGKLIFIRVALRDKSGKVAGVTDAVTAAAGKNLIADGDFEATAAGALPETRPAGEVGWVLTDAAGKFFSGYEIVEGGHTFSAGHRQLTAARSDEQRVYTNPIQLDRKKQYLLGGWVLCEEGDARICRLALDEAGKPIRSYVVAKSHPAKEWVFCVQRLTEDDKLTYSDGKDERVEDKTANVMPAAQQSCRIGFEIQGKARVDDVFLVECAWASMDKLFDALPAGETVVDPDAADKLSQAMAGESNDASSQPAATASTKPATGGARVPTR